MGKNVRPHIELVADAREYLGEIDIYCSNAGIAVGAGPDAPDAAWQQSWEVNLMAHVRASRELLPAWLERGRGHLMGVTLGVLEGQDYPLALVLPAPAPGGGPPGSATCVPASPASGSVAEGGQGRPAGTTSRPPMAMPDRTGPLVAWPTVPPHTLAPVAAEHRRRCR